MSLRAIDTYFLEKEEPVKSCLLFLRAHILNMDPDISEAWKYGMPFIVAKENDLLPLGPQKESSALSGYCRRKKIDHPGLIQEKRTQMKFCL